MEVSKIVTKIGKAARVLVNTDGHTKYAAAHDQRREFGERWAGRIMPQQLMEMIRHESIHTTMRFCVRRNAQKTAAILWDDHKEMTRQRRGIIDAHDLCSPR